MEIWAHRGASRVAPENTMPAFERAIAAGADGIEFDVQLSRDGEVVVIHDETLSRTTDGTGRVVDHTLAELRALDASAGRDSWTDVRIPTLAEVLALLAPTTLRADIELKNSEEPYPGLEELVLAEVAAAGMVDRTLYSSFSGESVRRLAGLAPAAEVALIYSSPLARPLRMAVMTRFMAAICGSSWSRSPCTSSIVKWSDTRPRNGRSSASRRLATRTVCCESTRGLPAKAPRRLRPWP